jgi:hypothetical protein
MHDPAEWFSLTKCSEMVIISNILRAKPLQPAVEKQSRCTNDGSPQGSALSWDHLKGTMVLRLASLNYMHTPFLSVVPYIHPGPCSSPSETHVMSYSTHDRTLTDPLAIVLSPRQHASILY